MQRSLIGAIAALLLISAPASATLMITVTGTPGTGLTTWNFSGSATVSGLSSSFSSADFISDSWLSAGDYVDASFQNRDIPLEGGSLIGDATVTVAGVTRDIDTLFLDQDSDSPGDDEFGIGVSGVSDLPLNPGDVVEWSGTLTIGGVDLNNLTPGTHTSSTHIEAELDLQLNIVSTPAPFALLALDGLLAWLVPRRTFINKREADS